MVKNFSERHIEEAHYPKEKEKNITKNVTVYAG